jgi:hypothetical protein
MNLPPGSKTISLPAAGFESFVLVLAEAAAAGAGGAGDAGVEDAGSGRSQPDSRIRAINPQNRFVLVLVPRLPAVALAKAGPRFFLEFENEDEDEDEMFNMDAV